MMKPLFGILLLPAMALAKVVALLPANSSVHSGPLFALDDDDDNNNNDNNDNTNISLGLFRPQIDPQASGSSCADEGAWFCMSNNFQRCASGEWSIVQECAPGTQCEPLGLTHNTSQPAFGIYDGGSSGIVTTDASSTGFVVEPVTKTTTTDVIVTASRSGPSFTMTSSAKFIPTKTDTSTASSTSSILSAGVPKADTSDGSRMGASSWSSTVATMVLRLAAGFWRR